MGTGRLCEQVPFTDIHNLDTRIKDLWSGDDWRLAQLWTALPSDHTDQIRYHKPFINATVEDTMVDWILENIQQDSTTFLSTFWKIWRNRNNAVFNLQQTSIWESFYSTNSLIHVIRKVFMLDAVIDSCPPRLVKWNAPMEDQIAINTDGSVNQHGAGFGGLIRNADGTLIKGFHGHLHNSDILRVELHAVWKGLELCWSLNYRKVLCLTDSLLAVELVRDEVSRFHHYATIIHEV
ncbi:Ribonuclease H domain [Sesbania bispinosa]|nr:Ribonuclease H domain [Sesbania bispinosa]